MVGAVLDAESKNGKKKDSRIVQDEESLGEAVSTFQLHVASLQDSA